MRNFKLVSLLVLLMFACQSNQELPLYEGESFTLYKDKVVQGDNVAQVLSPTHITSNYKSPASTTYSRLISFKFSINEKDNELPVGINHWIYVGEEHESQVLKFGEPPSHAPEREVEFLPTNFEYTFKVDVSNVLQQFESNGYYLAPDGSKVAKEDFKGFYIAGGSEPLTWDFVNLEGTGLKLQPSENPNIYQITLTLNPYNEADYSDKTWKPTEDLTNRPQYKSEQPIVDALYNLSLEEAIKNIEPDSTLRTGAKWGGVWTRDVSYSIFLAFAYHEPEVAKISLRRKVRRDRIVQDTGSGGAWPVSSDRTTWCLAAWEIYKVTGDQDWLREVYPVIKNTLEDDFKTIYDPELGLYSGESSFLDWREQTYPKWMDNRDIYVSHNLGTNVVHFRAHEILVEMARILGEPFELYETRAEAIKSGIDTHLWSHDKGYHGQFLYGRPEMILSPRFETLGEALAILFDVTDKNLTADIVSNAPMTEFGATCIYPQIPNIPPYHNNGIWPFVQAYWNLAAAKTGNEKVLNHGLAAIYRAAGLFLTNYENMVAETGDFLGTEINSHRMLWSMAGNLAMVHRVFMGMEFQTNGLNLNPVIPETYGGTKSLTNFKYRDAVINITIEGYGFGYRSVTINGQPADQAFIPANAKGTYDIAIQMDNRSFPEQKINKVPNRFTPATVLAKLEGDKLIWDPVSGAFEYKVYRNGQFLRTIHGTSYELERDSYSSYMISAIDADKNEGFASAPVVYAPDIRIVEIEQFAPKSDLPFSNFSGEGFVEFSLDQNRELIIPLTVNEAGTYLIDFRYSNGEGRWNTDNKCAIRSLTVNDRYEGVIVLPQRGQDEWSDWGYSNVKQVNLNAGNNQIKIHFEDWNHNMNVEVNRAMLDNMRLIKI